MVYFIILLKEIGGLRDQEGGQLIGQTLKKRREELGLDLERISKTTRIRYEYLKAIENEAFDKLPVEVVEVYVKGYIREYAKILSIDPQPIIDAYMQQISPPEKKEIPQKETLQEKPKAQYIVFVLLSVLIGASILFILYLFTPEKRKTIAPPSETKKEIVEAEHGIPHTLEVVAEDTTWLVVTIDGTMTKEILLNPAESVKWNAQKGFSLKIGNAGGIKLIFDGKDIGPVGKKGEVITIKLPPSNP